MSTWKNLGRVLALTILLAAGTSPVAGKDGGYVVVVHPDSPIREVSRTFVRDAFLKRNADWPHGPPIRPVDLTPAAPARTTFTRDVLGRGVSEIKRYWQQQIFSGKNVPPPELPSEIEVIDYVLKHAGAIGYLPTSADAQRVRAVAVK